MFADSFGSMVFNEKVMRDALSSESFKRLMKIRHEGMPMDDKTLADEVAEAMKKWAVSKGATHYTHWFQPMTGATAEKHDSFLDRDSDGNPILELSGKTLLKGESDASSFPSGGMRETFEARGYTVWDPTSDAFIREDTLCIPTSFGSFDGAVLDKKTPLLRSVETLNTQAVRLLRTFGIETKYVYPSVGLEQEYFLINKEDCAKRRDLILTERTLFGAPTPKGQVLEDHYYGTIRPRVKAFMKELDDELWKVGIYSKTEHNEVAPCQHEMAPIFARSNIAVDENQLTMDIMKKVANRHGFVCLLHEKPFEGINGSGKHNNWSISTAEGENLMNPGKEPEKNIKFLLFITAVIKAVDDYQVLLRISVSSAGNDRRLGGNEAPPAIISMYLGDRLRTIIASIISGSDLETETKKAALTVKNDDRNRTSPFAFTGNKFEFRMPGSAENVSCTNYVLNTIVAESLKQFADRLEPFAGKENFESEVRKLIREELTAHERILFEGNGYSKEWVKEAKRRGLAAFKSTPEAFEHFDDEKNIELLVSHGILNKEEIKARKVIGFTKYNNIINVEARTMLLMAEKDIVPAAIKYSSELAYGIESKQALQLDVEHELKLVSDINEHVKALMLNNETLRSVLDSQPTDPMKQGMNAYKKIVPVMEEERRIVDELELLVDKNSWPYPDYTDMLYYV
ncbi:MAG: glutamine synthetase III [Eubacteriales bacterium]|nr:glutamine synthetase III [Eubacteriales bacterium]